VALLFPSCASIVSTGQWTVPVRSEPSGARYTITDRKGRVVKQGHTPAFVQLRSSNGYFQRAIYRISFEMDGRMPATAELRARVNGWYWGNFLFLQFAPIGLLAVDPLTGAMYRMDHQLVLETLPLAY
jgi:hypothetical protein